MVSQSLSTILALLRRVAEPMAGAPLLARAQADGRHTLPRLDTHEARPVLRPQVRHVGRPLLPGVPHHAVGQVGLTEAQGPARGAETLNPEAVGG